jgi:general secretion pathway protein E
MPNSVAGAGAEGPIVAFVDHALKAAFRLGASDVHFECDRSGVNVKHRLDGVMVPFAAMEGAQPAQEVVSRIKVLAQLDITERRLPQDGRIRFRFDASEIDLRVSIMPSVHGEDAVLRLLDKSQLRGRDDRVTLDGLGFSDANADHIRALARAPSGMLLVTGPTGSGKTTTVYAALSEINTGLEKIITIEDPVEYELAGVLQIPVNERKGLTFATGLRSILRHDPDRILVGEIRDAETAEIAVQSALTGHLVFTTVHANSVADVVGRFRHFGIDMFGFMAALNGVVVQRLVRRICPHCAASAEIGPAEASWLAGAGMGQQRRTPLPVGCAQCRHTGYKGRFIIAEVHRIDDELRDHITAGAPLSTLKTHAVKQGVLPLLAQAAEHVAAGHTTSEEIRRVVGGI